jgi:cAMP-dependent protein kinase regulator
VRFFRHLRVEALEGVAAQLEPLAVHAGSEVITQGARDEDRWYLVERGELDVYVEGFLVNELARGDGFGELALIRNASRAATVRARTDVQLLSLGRAGFLAAVAGPDIRPSPNIEAVGRGTEDHTDLLRGTPLLGGIDRRALAPMVRVAVLREVDAGTAIVIEDQIDDRYYVLLSGRATVVVGAERRLVLLPGDGFGEIAVLHKVPRAATVLAEERCRLLSVPGEEVRAIARERGGLLGKLADGY